MFPFQKPPSRAETAKKAVADAVSGAAHTLSDTVTSAAATAGQVAESLSERAHDLVEKAPTDLHLAQAAEKLGALKAGASAGVAAAGAGLAEKVASAREKTAPPTEAAVPDVRRARKQAQSQINTMQKQAEQYRRDLEKTMAREEAQFEADKARLDAEKERLMRESEDEINRIQKRARRRKNRREAEEEVVMVPVAPTDEIIAYDEDGEPMPDYDAEDYDEDYGKSGGNGWLWFGGLLLAGAGAVYYLFSTTGGKRSKAAIQDRISQVKSGDRETVIEPSDAGEEVAEVTEAATEAFDRSNERIGARAPGLDVEEAPDETAEKLGEVGDKVAGGISKAGDFIADKLEAAGAGAKSAADSAAAKLDEAKSQAAPPPAQPRPATLGDAVPTGVPADAVIVEVVTDKPLQAETTEEILAEVEETVQNIEESVRQEKK